MLHINADAERNAKKRNTVVVVQIANGTVLNFSWVHVFTYSFVNCSTKSYS